MFLKEVCILPQKAFGITEEHLGPSSHLLIISLLCPHHAVRTGELCSPEGLGTQQGADPQEPPGAGDLLSPRDQPADMVQCEGDCTLRASEPG